MSKRCIQRPRTHDIHIDLQEIIPEIDDTERFPVIPLQHIHDRPDGILRRTKRLIAVKRRLLHHTDCHTIQLIATNSFHRRVNMRYGRYRSTNRNGNGIGLTSIISTAEHYGGTANFTYEGEEFYTNVVLPLDQEPESA